MTSVSKKTKTDKKKHMGRGGRFLKSTTPLKGIAFFNASNRRKLKRELLNELEKEEK